MFIRLLKNLFARDAKNRRTEDAVEGFEEMGCVRKDTKGGPIGDSWDGGFGRWL